jgi:type III restriction enzyme
LPLRDASFFVALLDDGHVLVVEYKGSHIATADDAKQKQLIGELWAERSRGRCLFLMIENREFSRIDKQIYASLNKD